MSDTKYSLTDTTNPYGFKGVLGTGVGRHSVSRYDKFLPSDRNFLEEVITEIRRELSTQISDTTSLHQQITQQVYVPNTKTSAVNVNYLPVDFRAAGEYKPTNSLDGPLELKYEGYINRVIVHRNTPGIDGTTAINVKIDGTSILDGLITIGSDETAATVVTDFTSTYYEIDSNLTVDIIDVEANASDLMVTVELAFPFQSNVFLANFSLTGRGSITENLDGFFIVPFESEWKYWQGVTDSTSLGQYSITAHRLDTTTSAGPTTFPAPGEASASLNENRIQPGELFSVSVNEVPSSGEDMRATLTFNRRIPEYYAIMDFQAMGNYYVTENADIARYIPENITIKDVYLTRSTGGTDNTSVFTLNDDGVEIARVYIDSSTAIYDSTGCHVSPEVEVAAGSYLTLDIIGVEDGVPSDARCMVVYDVSIPTTPIGLADSTETAELRNSFISLDSSVADISTHLGLVDTTASNTLASLNSIDSTVSDILSRLTLLDTTASQLTDEYLELDATVDYILYNQLLNNNLLIQFGNDLDSFDSTLAEMSVGLGIFDSTISEMSDKIIEIDSTASEISSRINIIDSTTAEMSIKLIALDSTVSELSAVVGDTPEYDYVDLDTSYGKPVHQPGRLFWDDDNKTVAMYTDSTEVTLQIGQEDWTRVKNETGNTIVNGRAVNVVGVNGNGIPLVDFAHAGDSTYNHCHGLMTHNLETGNIGYMVSRGIIHDIDTSWLSAGDPLYLCDSTAGLYGTTIPTAAASAIQEIGVVLESGVSGSALVHPHAPSRNSERAFERSWAITSLSGASGDYYFGGFYKHGGTHDDFSGVVNFGSANVSYAAHFFVVLGASTVDELTIHVTGTSINDNGDRATSDTEDIVIPTLTSVNAYFETSKKWLGQISVTVTGGTAKDCNYGFSKYWDNNNNAFQLIGLEVTGLAGASDTGIEIRLIHHTSSGWTYNAGSSAVPAVLASMSTDHSTESRVASGEEFAWKRSNLDTSVAGGDSEGTIFFITTTVNDAVEVGTAMIRIITDITSQ